MYIVKNVGVGIFLKEDSYSHQDCILFSSRFYLYCKNSNIVFICFSIVKYFMVIYSCDAKVEISASLLQSLLILFIIIINAENLCST